MKLYLLSQNVNNGYDTYDSMIVAASTKEEARRIHPMTENGMVEEGIWISSGKFRSNWAETPDQVKVELLGLAVKGTKKGIILTSFNAG
jgi:hypothetical protein